MLCWEVASSRETVMARSGPAGGAVTGGRTQTSRICTPGASPTPRGGPFGPFLYSVDGQGPCPEGDLGFVRTATRLASLGVESTSNESLLDELRVWFEEQSFFLTIDATDSGSVALLRHVTQADPAKAFAY